MSLFRHDRFFRLSLIVLTMMLLHPLAVADTIQVIQDNLPAITGFTGETVPGSVTRMRLEWILTDAPSGAVQRLYLESAEGDARHLTELPITTTEYEVDVEVGSMSHPYRLDLLLDDEVIASGATEGHTARKGGFASFEAVDAPYDAGGEIELSWILGDAYREVKQLRLYRTSPGQGKWELIAAVDTEPGIHVDTRLEDGVAYSYMARFSHGDGVYESKPAANIVSQAAWFNMSKINLLIIAVIILSAIIIYVMLGGKKSMYIRRIAGLQAVEEAVGRATEMGRSVLFIPGIQDLDDVQTIAGLTILGAVSKMTAQYETRLDVPVSRSLVMSNGREVVKEAYMSVGRPDLYHNDIVHYVTDEQFGYVASVDGIMVREKPAACFYMGAFFAESLILAETGNHVGAIQIAGTAMPTQLPFFVAACDYCLIGEELFAASAYMSGDNRMIASLRGQDIGKAMAMGSILFGACLMTLVSITGSSFFVRASDAFIRLFALNY